MELLNTARSGRGAARRLPPPDGLEVSPSGSPTQQGPAFPALRRCHTLRTLARSGARTFRIAARVQSGRPRFPVAPTGRRGGVGCSGGPVWAPSAEALERWRGRGGSVAWPRAAQCRQAAPASGRRVACGLAGRCPRLGAAAAGWQGAEQCRVAGRAAPVVAADPGVPLSDRRDRAAGRRSRVVHAEDLQARQSDGGDAVVQLTNERLTLWQDGQAWRQITTLVLRRAIRTATLGRCALPELTWTPARGRVAVTTFLGHWGGHTPARVDREWVATRGGDLVAWRRYCQRVGRLACVPLETARHPVARVGTDWTPRFTRGPDAVRFRATSLPTRRRRQCRMAATARPAMRSGGPLTAPRRSFWNAV